MSTQLKLTTPKPEADTAGFSLSDNSKGVTIDELSENAMGGTEMMKYGLYERLADDIKDEVQIICSRVRNVDTHRPSILWLHDMFNDPEAVHLREQESRDRFAKLVFVSQWQFNTYNMAMGVPYSDSLVLRNAIDPIPRHNKPDSGPIKLIYHTTPHRGLELLVPVVEALSEIHSDIHLDVYSSFKAYGWEARDEPYQELFNKIKQHPNMTYHGYQPNSVVRKALEEAHIFAYPSIWQETSCIAAMEAMSAGCSVVCPNFGALPETTANFAFMYQYNEDYNKHANIFASALENVISMHKTSREALKDRLSFQKAYVDNFYNWGSRVREWDALIRSILKHAKKTS